MGTYKAVLIVISALMVQLGGGDDLYWIRNSNWGDPNNWALGRVPSCGDSASFKTAPANSVVFIDTDTTLTSLILPENGRLVLGRSVTIKISPGVECTVSGDKQPMAAVVNEFVGADTDYWECSDNWRNTDGSAVEHSPCGTDTAIFEKGSFSFVGANNSVDVRSMVVRGTNINSLTELNSTEFKLKLEVNPKCGDDPSLCPCLDDKRCPKSKEENGNTGKLNNAKKRDGIIAGVILTIVLVAVIALSVVVFIVAMYLRRGTPYAKEELIDEPNASNNSEGNVFNNPVFSDDVKVDLGEDVPAEAKLPEKGGVKEERVSKSSKYERF